MILRRRLKPRRNIGLEGLFDVHSLMYAGEHYPRSFGEQIDRTSKNLGRSITPMSVGWSESIQLRGLAMSRWIFGKL